MSSPESTPESTQYPCEYPQSTPQSTRRSESPQAGECSEHPCEYSRDPLRCKKADIVPLGLNALDDDRRCVSI